MNISQITGCIFFLYLYLDQWLIIIFLFTVWAQNDFRDEPNNGLARLDSSHGAHTPGGSTPSTPGATPATPSGGFSTAQPRNQTNNNQRTDNRKRMYHRKKKLVNIIKK